MRRILLTITFFIFTNALRSGAQELQVWTLRDCMIYAIENSPETKIQELTNDNRRLDHRDAYLEFVPSVNGNINAYTSFGRSIDPETNTYSNVNSFSNSYAIYSNYTIFNGFTVVDKYKVTRIARLSGIEEARQVEDNLCLTIMQSYYNVLYRKGMVQLCREQLMESQTTLKNTRVLEELGLKSYADVLQVEAQVAANDYNLVREQNMMESEFISLKEKMFFPSDRELVIDTTFSQIADPFAGSVTAGDIYLSALEFLPAVKISAFDVKTAGIKLHNAKWSLLPNIFSEAGYSTGYISTLGQAANADPFLSQMKNRQGEYVQVGMSIPLFGRLNRQSAVGRMRNALHIAEAQRDKKLKEIESEIARAVQDMEGSAKEFIQADKRVAAQDMAHKANQRKYEEGLLSVLELQTSSNQALAAKAERLNSALTYLIKKRIVGYYQGTSYINQE